MGALNLDPMTVVRTVGCQFLTKTQIQRHPFEFCNIRLPIFEARIEMYYHLNSTRCRHMAQMNKLPNKYCFTVKYTSSLQ